MCGGVDAFEVVPVLWIDDEGRVCLAPSSELRLILGGERREVGDFVGESVLGEG